jgi:hypothetical protein
MSAPTPRHTALRQTRTDLAVTDSPTALAYVGTETGVVTLLLAAAPAAGVALREHRTLRSRS